MHRRVPGKVELMEETQTFFSLEKLSQGGETAPTDMKDETERDEHRIRYSGSHRGIYSKMDLE